MSIDNATPEEWDAIVQAHHAGVVAQGDDKSDHLLRRLNAALEKPFSEVPIYWRCLAFAFWQQGHRVQHNPGGSAWLDATNSVVWAPRARYRILPKPEELVLPSIDWSHVAPKWKWLAQDHSGAAFLHESKPITETSTMWHDGGSSCHAMHFASFRPGKGDWRKLIVQRPEGV